MNRWKATLYDDHTYKIEEIDMGYTTPGNKGMRDGNHIFFIKNTRDEVVNTLKNRIQKEMLDIDSKLFTLRNLIENIK